MPGLAAQCGGLGTIHLQQQQQSDYRLQTGSQQAISQEKHRQTDRQRDKSTARFLSLPFPGNEPHVANLVYTFVPPSHSFPSLSLKVNYLSAKATAVVDRRPLPDGLIRLLSHSFSHALIIFLTTSVIEL